MAELNPDDPIVEIPMQVVCMVCKTVISESVAHWPQSHIRAMEKFSWWKGVVVSSDYCEEHKPQKRES